MVRFTNALAIIGVFSTVSNAKAPANVEDYVAKFGKLLGDRPKSVQKGNTEKPEHAMWNMLKRGMQQIVDEESRNNKLRAALQHKLEDKFLNELGLGTEYNKRASSLSNFEGLNSRLQPGLFKKSVGPDALSFMNLFKKSVGSDNAFHSGSNTMMLEEGLKNLNLGRFKALLGSLRNQEKRDAEENEMLKNEVKNEMKNEMKSFVKTEVKNELNNEKRAWEANVNGLFKKDVSDSGAAHQKPVGTIEIYKKNDGYYPIFKRSGQDGYYPIFKRAQDGYFPIF